MKKAKKARRKKNKARIAKVGVTNDIITGRGGMALFSRYLDKVGILELLNNKFSFMRKSSKGLSIWLIFKQVICWFFDGTSRHISYFNQIKYDEGYASAIETRQSLMASSHVIKRFFRCFNIGASIIFRPILRMMFIWRLKIQKVTEIRLYVDSMVLNNDDANKRQGVQPTYKKVKGFKPLQIIWNGIVVDAIFRGGKKNCNYGDVMLNMVICLVNLIRKEYRSDVPIFLHFDSGFFDQDNFIAFDKLDIAFIASGKMYEGVKTYVGSASDDDWGTHDNGKKQWGFLEFGFSCISWKRFFRAIYTHIVCDKDGQMLLDFARPDNVIITNIGMNDKVLENCTPERREYWFKLTSIISSYHQCGSDELAHRGLKDFGFEQLPFKKFTSNMALYYCMLISFFLFETFKQDVLKDIVPIRSYATTVRRRVVDIAAKVINTGRCIILKVTDSVMKNLKFDILWDRCQTPHPIII